MVVRILKQDEQTVVPAAKVAKGFFERFFGLMGRKNLSSKDVLIFPNCNSIHTFFMREQIDVIFVSATGMVTKVFISLKPWRFLWPQKKAAHCIEMASTESLKLGIVEGDLLKCEGIF